MDTYRNNVLENWLYQHENELLDAFGSGGWVSAVKNHIKSIGILGLELNAHDFSLVFQLKQAGMVLRKITEGLVFRIILFLTKIWEPNKNISRFLQIIGVNFCDWYGDFCENYIWIENDNFSQTFIKTHIDPAWMSNYIIFRTSV